MTFDALKLADFVMNLKNLGFTLDEVKTSVKAGEADGLTSVDSGASPPPNGD